MPRKSKFDELRESERKNRKTILLDTAVSLFGTKSYHEISMRTIADAAGVSAASIYRYYPSREDLLVAALTRDLDTMEELLHSRLESGDASLAAFAAAAIDYLVDNEATFQMMCHFMVRGEMNPSALDMFNELQRLLLAKWDEVLRKAGNPGIDRFFAHTFVASLIGIVMSYRNYPGRDEAEKRAYMHELAALLCRRMTGEERSLTRRQSP